MESNREQLAAIGGVWEGQEEVKRDRNCLLYTSDAADE